MTPAARVQAAIEVLDRIAEGVSAEQALTGWARCSRFAGSGDRAAVRDHVFQALRCRRSFAALGAGETGRALMIGALHDQGIDHASVFNGHGHGPAPLTPEERNAGEHPQCEGARLDLPDWLVPLFRDALGGEAKTAALALRQRAPVVLRVNLAKADLARVRTALAADGIATHSDPIADTALIVTEGARRVAQTAAYGEGLIELQDGSSQAAMTRLELADGARVLDYCAGGGGKLLALAGRGRAAWFAHDALPQRMKDLPARAARAGIDVCLCDVDALRGQDPFDLVLCDVPCSGSGTWRRTPDAKWRLTPERLETLCREQASILAQAAGLVAEDGVLAYATCSVLRAENEARIEAFLTENTGWRLVAQERWPVSQAGDGFFLAQLTRGGASGTQP